MIDFFSEQSQHLAGPVWMLPQCGSVTGGTGRPMNSYAIEMQDGVILFDAPFTWVIDELRQWSDRGKPPISMVISHRDLVSSGNAYTTLFNEFGVTPTMHPDDGLRTAAQASGIPFQSPADDPHLRDSEIELLHMPGHSPGSIMLSVRTDQGEVILAGDSAVGPGPKQPQHPPRLERPMMGQLESEFIRQWKSLAETRNLFAVLPLHGQAYSRTSIGSDAFDEAVANLWEGPAMNPAG